MTRLRLRHLGLLGFILAGMLLAVISWLSHREQQQIAEQGRLVESTLRVRGDTRTLLSLMQDAETGQRGFLITGNPAFLAPYQEALHDLPEVRRRLGALTRNDRQIQASLNQIDPLMAVDLSELEESIRVRQAQGIDAAARFVATGRGRHAMDHIRALISSLLAEEAGLYDQREMVLAMDSRRAATWSVAGNLLALALIIASGILLARQYRGLERTASHLQQIESGYRGLIDAVEDYAIYTLDPKGQVASWNAGAERIKGYRADEIIGKHFSHFYLPEDVESGEPEKALKVAGTEGRFEREGWLVRKDGSRYWVNTVITALRDQSGRLAGYLKITRDLTSRMQAEQILRASEARYRAVVESANDAIISVDAAGNIVQWNKASERTFGYTASEALGKPLTLIMPERVRAAHREGLRRYLATREARLMGKSTDFTGKRRDGTEFPLELSLATWETGKEVFFTGAIHDISERVRQEQALRESRESLRELSVQLLRVQEEERRKLGRDLHDSIGQNLAMLKMQLDSIVSADGLGNAARAKLTEAIHLADEAIREVRTSSYELYPPMLEEAGLKTAIPWYLEGIRERSGMSATLEIPPDLQRAPREVELALFRVLQESLTNARRHSGSPTASVKVEWKDGLLELEVADQGRGIADPLPNGSAHRSHSLMGVGLRGMTERIRQLGGELEVTSNEQGTVVSASVPCRKSARKDSSF